jgi:hypothetical protein
MPRNKYSNRRTELDGYTFDSRAEARHYQNRKLELLAGDISGLEVHPRFELQPAYRHPQTGKKVLPIVYEGDVSYMRGGVRYVDDVKGVRTRDFAIKEKLFRFKYPDIVLLVIPAGEV